MRQIRKVLRLTLAAGVSIRQISASTKNSVGAIQKLLSRAEDHGQYLAPAADDMGSIRFATQDGRLRWMRVADCPVRRRWQPDKQDGRGSVNHAENVAQSVVKHSVSTILLCGGLSVDAASLIHTTLRLKIPC